MADWERQGRQKDVVDNTPLSPSGGALLDAKALDRVGGNGAAVRMGDQDDLLAGVDERFEVRAYRRRVRVQGHVWVRVSDAGQGRGRGLLKTPGRELSPDQIKGPRPMERARDEVKGHRLRRLRRVFLDGQASSDGGQQEV